MIGPPARYHWAPVERPRWAFWRKQRYVKCYCSFQALIDVMDEL